MTNGSEGPRSAPPGRGRPDYYDHPTKTSVSSAAVSDGSRRHLCLTVLWHPDLTFIGAQAHLFPEGSAGRIALSRLEPSFYQGADSTGPLASTHLSRSPLYIETVTGGVRLTDVDGRARLAIDAEQASGEVALGAERLERGVVVNLANVVLLLLHWRRKRTTPPHAHEMIGASAAMADLRDEIDKVADTDVRVMLLGQTGTGKELAARAIHHASRRPGSFVAVNVAELRPELAASLLFGAAEGAFTGAVRSRRGFFQRADRGTLFLDEIGEMPVEVQTSLLRAIESNEIQPVGASKPVEVNVRIISATDSNLLEGNGKSGFRAPLLHRLNEYAIELPSLVERRDDFGRLFVHFLEEELRRLGEDWPIEPRRLPATLVERLALHDWPGNVRQLRSAVRSLAIGSRGLDVVSMPPVLAAQIAPTLAKTGQTPTPRSAKKSLQSYSEEQVEEVLRRHLYRVKSAARELDVPRSSLYERIRRSGSFRVASDLEAGEVEAAMKACGDDLESAALELRVSPEGLKRRLQQLEA